MIYATECNCGCGKVFETTLSRQKYLKGHYNKFRRSEYHKGVTVHPSTHCAYLSCGKLFTPKYSRQRFCTTDHASQYKVEHEAGGLFIRIPRSLLDDSGNGIIQVVIAEWKVEQCTARSAIDE